MSETKRLTVKQTMDGFRIAIEARDSLIAEMYEALKAMVEDYVELVDSGDCGRWDYEQDDCLKVARAALAKAEGGAQ